MPISGTTESAMYQTLQHPDSFRLLRLRNSPSDDEWKGSLVEERLPNDPSAADAPKYVALSYCWGDPPFNVTGKNCIEITLSLSKDFASILQNAAETGILNIWIDQICINQRDTREKEHRFGMMWCIYARAEKVIGWLGPPFHGSRQALAELVLFAGPDDEVPAEEWEQIVRRLRGKFDLDAILECLWKINLHGSDLRRRMLSFFQRPWFSRRWIAQEACLATNLRIYCGLQSVSGNQLFRSLRLIQGIIHPVVSPWLQKPFRNAFTLLHVRDVVQSHRSIPFPYLLQRLSFLDCKEEQNRINALCGIFSSNSWYTPEYCPAPNLYVKFALEHMRQSQSLEILHFAGITDPSRHEFDEAKYPKEYIITSPAKDLPSWVPDWRVERRPLPILPTHSYLLGQERGISSFKVPVDPLHERLTLKAKLLSDEIKPCGIPHLDPLTPKEDPRFLYSLDPWCNRFFVNFLAEFDPSLALQYRKSSSFVEWRQSLVQVDEDPRDLLLRFARTLIMNGKVKSSEKPDCIVPEDEILEYFLEYAKLHLVADSCAGSLALHETIRDSESMEKAAAYGYLAEEVCRYRTLLVGNCRVVGLGVPGISSGDRVCFFSGLKTPFVLHPRECYFELRGECYIDGLMDTSFDELEEPEQEIVLK